MNKKREYYVCKKLRLLEELLDAGFTPIKTIPDANKYWYKN